MTTLSSKMSAFMDNISDKAARRANGVDEISSDGNKRTTNDKTQNKGIFWNIKKIINSYANIFSASAIREEVIIYFGQNKPVNLTPGIHQADLKARIILNPHAAKRLSLILNKAMQEYDLEFRNNEDRKNLVNEQIQRASEEASNAIKH